MTNPNTSATGKSSSPKIILNDLRPDELAMREYEGALREVMESGRFILGPQVDYFEKELAHWTTVPYVVGVASGTDALELALRAGAKHRDGPVVTVGNSAPATAIAIVRAGYSPLYVEVDRYGLMDSEELDELFTKCGTKGIAAIVPVDLYGQRSISLRLQQVAKEHDIPIIQDAAQSLGSAGMGRGSAAAVSFYPTKSLGGLGDGGAVLTYDPLIAERVRAMRFYGMHLPSTHVQDFPFGINSRLDELQAAFLRRKLKWFGDDIRRRKVIASYYLEHLNPELLRRNYDGDWGPQNWHLFTIHCRDRDKVRDWLLNEKGIQTAVHYPIPAWQQPMTQGTTHRCSMPMTWKFMKSTLTLPCHDGLSVRDVDFVCQMVNHRAEPE